MVHIIWPLVYSCLLSPKQKIETEVFHHFDPPRVNSDKCSFSLYVYSMAFSFHSKNFIKTGNVSSYYLQKVIICVLYKLIKSNLLIGSPNLYLCCPLFCLLIKHWENYVKYAQKFETRQSFKVQCELLEIFIVNST